MSNYRCNSCFNEYDKELGICPYCGYCEGETAVEPFCLMPGTILSGRYIIGHMIRLGGFGIIYKAWDKNLEAVVAVKEFFQSSIVNREPRKPTVYLAAKKMEKEFLHNKESFLEEARMIAKFNKHPHIANVIDFFEANNTAYIVMEFLEGKNLSEIMKENNKPFDVDFAIKVGLCICDALKTVHAQNIVHRDISPDNIMLLKDGNLKLIDFGAARYSAGNADKSKVTVIVKVGFAPPEQYDKVNKNDGRTDIYALGATLYYLMTGKKPEESNNRTIEDTLPSPHLVNDKIPENISLAIMRAMAVQMQYRFSNVDEFAQALKNEVTVKTVESIKRAKKLRIYLGVAAACAVVAAGAAIVIVAILNTRASVTLPDADITIWYLKASDDEKNEKKKANFDKVIAQFTKEYSNVKIEAKDIDKDNLLQELQLALENNEMPDIFDSSFLSQDALDLYAKKIEAKTDNQNVLKPKNANEKQFAASVNFPVIYNNTSSENEINKDNVKELETVYISSDANLFDLSSEIKTSVLTDAKNQFVDEKIMFYIGSTADYFYVQENLPAKYKINFLDDTKDLYEEATFYSISNKVSDAENKVSNALLEYFVSDLAQDYLYIQTKESSLPINIAKLQDFILVYQELEGVF